ncbi:separase isoform X1, partial [Tanacetum coccineum]
CDSAATLAKAYSQVYNGKSRHLGVRHSMIRELIMNGVISVEFVKTQLNLADHVTKGLARDLVRKAAIGMGKLDIFGLEHIITSSHGARMLPWENLPILRHQDVSRMPSVMSISSTIRKRCSYDDNDHMVFPTIDPRDAYYVLNPQGDLKQLERNLTEWFSKQKFEGIVGTSPAQDKLRSDCISGDIVRNLDRCVAAMLIGCSSGCLHLNGSYLPHGLVLDYLAAASPVVVSHLWDITTSNATQITKTLVKSLMHSKDDKTTVGSSMGSAKESCYFPYLQGASLICNGIQTRIRKKVRLNDAEAK